MSFLDFSKKANEISESRSVSQSETDYFKSRFVISIQAIIWYFEPLKEWWEFFMLVTQNLATRSITDLLSSKVKQKYKTNITVINDFPDIILARKKDDPNEVYNNYKVILENLCEECEKEWKVLVLGFSSLWWYELLPRLSEIIEALKCKYKNIVFIIWWADYNALPEKEFLDKTFSYWIDIVNIWWAEEFTDFFWWLNSQDTFYRDEKWNLRITTDKQIPWNLIFAHQKDSISTVIPWKKINTTFYYNDFKRELYFAINNNPCLNNCSYCANHIHDTIPLKDSDIDEAIKDYNNYTSWIDCNKIRLTIWNPNPLQYIDKFERFLNWIDLSNVKELAIFGDFMWMWNDKIYEKVIKLIDNLLEKYPNLSITTHFWIDAVHHKWDWEFVWRTIWLKIAEEPKYVAWFRNFDKFYEKYKSNNRVYIPFNVIFHPNMDLADYKERADIINKYKWKSNFQWLYSLIPHLNTKLEQDHKWFYIPEHKAIDVVDLIKNQNFRNLSYWWHFYLNSKLLDIFVLFQLTWLLYIFDDIIKSNINKWNNEIDFIKICTWLWYKLEKDIEYESQWKIRRKNYKRYKLIQESTIKRISIIITLIEFMIYRENYICNSNPEYQNEQVNIFIQDLELLKKWFKELSKYIKT